MKPSLWHPCPRSLTCTLPEVCDAGRICTMFAAAATADSLEPGPAELVLLLPLGGPPPRGTGRPGPPELELLLLWGSWPELFSCSPIEAVPFSSTMLSIASCLSCHSPRPELPASFEILPAVFRTGLVGKNGEEGDCASSAEPVTQSSEGSRYTLLVSFLERRGKKRKHIL